MAIIDQKGRYRRQAALCYELAKTMDGERAESMVRLGDAYSDLAETPGYFREHIFSRVTSSVLPFCGVAVAEKVGSPSRGERVKLVELCR